MVKPRIIETDHGIQGEYDIEIYDQMMRRMRDKGWIETNLILKAGITQGLVLEMGPGPGYLGLEWLKKTEGTSLRALEIELTPDQCAWLEVSPREMAPFPTDIQNVSGVALQTAHLPAAKRKEHQ